MEGVKIEGESETNSEWFFYSFSFHFDPVLRCIPLNSANQRHLEIPSRSLSLSHTHTERERDWQRQRDRVRNRIGHLSFFMINLSGPSILIYCSFKYLYPTFIHPSILQPNIHLVMLYHPPITPQYPSRVPINLLFLSYNLYQRCLIYTFSPAQVAKS